MRAEIDLALVTQDPSFGGGARVQAEAFARAARELGREPRSLYLERRRATSLVRPALALAPAPAPAPLSGTAYPSLLPELDALNQLSAARMLPALRRSRSAWVVAAAAHYGAAAALARRPYACWIGTGLTEEWVARRRGLRASRRLALTLNAPVLRRLEREVLRRAALVYATSPASRASVAAAGGLALESVGVLPIPVALERFAPEPDDAWRRRAEREPVVVFVGRATDPRKNLRLLLDAFPGIRARVPAVRLRLVGEPPPPEAVRGLDGAVEVVGEVASVAEPLRRASLLVLPSLQEGFGITVAEALASGVPAIVTPCGGPEHLVGASGGGRVLAAFDAGELAEAAATLLSEPERLLELRRRGREHVLREHSPERLRALLADAFAELERRG